MPSLCTVLFTPPGVFDWGENITPPQGFLSDCESPLNGKIGETLTTEGRPVCLSPRYSLARTASKVSSENSPCNNASARSNCQDEGTRLSGAKSDNAIGDSVGDVVSAVSCDKEADADILIERPTNMPTIPATPTDMNAVIGT